ncbi:6-phosphogluconolactonase [Testudinibacter aquarius]|uniref:6-phosphogluconolactonase n=1 Tax=Testudinibacter aquarius TaxID=1524974 RepID=A0A4R3Y2D3_9PAST|nr:6-phosphogluconolactonase [Testudinibacter aquarius]KAE9527819.1 6-phosphogluconolactonase [Testudinibacter aquarius]TCV84868.1 6-phosphogluconolactonase [Testudinibacter aquarius]TNG92776.1 6-phosphogluconolactonase [Testudinibacter aquarius]
MNYITFADAQSAVEKIAEAFLTYSQQAKPVHISLSGGSTPKLLFKTLAEQYADKINWQNLHFWWGDERCVAPDDEESNYGEVQRLLFDHIQIPAENIHRIRGEDDPEAEAKRFADEMLALLPKNSAGVPEFDWIILGMGPDGHTASLFPLQVDFATTELTIVAKQPQSGQLRVSKSAYLIENAKRLTYLVTGASKADLLHEIQQAGENELPYPAARIKANNGNTEWYLDADAASQLQ